MGSPYLWKLPYTPAQEPKASNSKTSSKKQLDPKKHGAAYASSFRVSGCSLLRGRVLDLGLRAWDLWLRVN